MKDRRNGVSETAELGTVRDLKIRFVLELA